MSFWRKVCLLSSCAFYPSNEYLVKKKGAYVSKAVQLAHSFHLNFDKFANGASEEILNGGPLIDSHHSLEEHF